MLPTLYKKTKTGAIEQWAIQAYPKLGGLWVLETSYGHVDGQIQVTHDSIKTGKRGTTIEQQAQKEARAKWDKQVKKGYVESLADAQAGQNALGGVEPMLAHRYEDHESKITWPAFIQPKLDGQRCLAMCDLRTGAVTLWTRSRKPINSVPHIQAALERLVARELMGKGLKSDTLTFDGELLLPRETGKDDSKKFQGLMSLVRPATPVPGHERVQYNVYDLVSDAPFALRSSVVQTLLSILPTEPSLCPVVTLTCDSPEDMTLAFRKFRQGGYEGLMVRNDGVTYTHGRTWHLLKVKKFMDAEFVIRDVVEGRGRMQGHAVFVCTSKAGIFHVKMEGSLDKLKEIWENRSKYIGRLLTVEFQNFTNDGLPRCPVAVRLYEPS